MKKNKNNKGCPKNFVTKNRLINDLKKIVLPQNNNDLPSYSINRNTDYGLKYDIHGAIIKFGGYNKIRKALKIPIKRKNNGYWSKWENIEQEIKKTFDLKEKIFPSYEDIETARIPINYICKIHSLNLNQLASKFNCKLISKYKCRDGHIVDSLYEAILDEYFYSRNISHETQVPIGKYRTDFKLSNDLYIEIWGFRKKDISTIGKSYNKKRKKKEKYFKSLNISILNLEGPELFKKPLPRILEIESELDKIFKSYEFDISAKLPFNAEIIADGGFCWSESLIKKKIEQIIEKNKEFPTIKDLKKEKISSIVSNFGGINHFRKLMGYPIQFNPFKGKQKQIWSDEIILERLKNWIKKLSRCPKQKELLKFDVQLLRGITLNGGLEKFKTIIGEQKCKPKNYWNEQRIMEELLRYPEFPSGWRLLKEKSHDLSNAIRRNGGFILFRKKYEDAKINN